MFNSLQLAICIGIILRPVSFARKISLEVSPKKCFVLMFFHVEPRGKISLESSTKNYSYHCVTVFYFYNITFICRWLRKRKVLWSQFKSFKSKCSPSIGNRQNYDLEFLPHKTTMKFAFYFFF